MGNIIPDKDSYTFESLDEILLRLSNNGTPLPLIFKEIYERKRIIFYTTEEMAKKYKNTINVFLFYYGRDIVFCSDNKFSLLGGGFFSWGVTFVPVNELQFNKDDLFFAFSLSFEENVYQHIKNKLEQSNILLLTRPFIGSLNHYNYRIRPIKNLLTLHPGIKIVLVGKYSFDLANATKWEKYLYENNLTREKMVRLLNDNIYPYPDGLYSEKYTAEELLSMNYIPHREMDTRGVLSVKDYNSKFVNIRNGIRITVGQPKIFNNTIHIFGGCEFFGVGMPDKATFASVLQRLCNEVVPEKKYKVENHGYFIWGLQDAMWYLLNSTPLKLGDIVVIPYNEGWAKYFYKDIPNVVFADITKRGSGEIFNDAWHPSENGIRTYANNLFNFLQRNNFLEDKTYAPEDVLALERVKQYGIPAFADAVHSNELNKIKGLDRKNKELLINYIQKISNYKPLIGSIVMNCNPFTLGHRYLIEYAASRVEHLFIFAVEEDKSFFPFKDRIELIRKGTADLSNVTVIPSGQFIISAITFTDYFGKSELQDKTIDASMDLEIFGMYIAPALNINIRFAGEEPIDKVTKQYNEQMKKILPTYGIKFEEVPRKEAGGNVISASRVRQLLKLKDFKEIKKLVPRSTFEYLKKNFS